MALCDDVDLDRDRVDVLRFQAGEVEAFEDLYRRYFARLTRFCQRRLDDACEAEEVAQEAFARAFRALPQLGGEQRFYPWLTVIAARLCIDAHRRRARLETRAEPEDQPVEGGQEVVLRAVDLAHLAQAMDRLVPRHREVLAFREGRGWTYRQIAEHYDVSLGTVELLIFRARKALRREFLAVAGGVNAGVPLLAWVRIRWAALRSRMADPAAAQLAPVFGGVASVALVASVVAGTLLPPAASPRPAAPPAVTALDRSPRVAIPPDRAGDSPPAPSGAPASTAGAVRHGVAIVGADEGRRRAEQKSTAIAVGPVVVGVDHDAARRDLESSADRWTRQLQGVGR